MPPTSDEASQLTPCQFAYFKTVQPTTTSSGVVPGRAPLDTPSPGRSPSPPLKRSQRSRRPSTRKVEGEASQVRPSTSKSQGKKRAQSSAGKQHGRKAGHASNANTSKSATVAGPQAGSTAMASPGGATVNYAETQRETQGGYGSQGEEGPSEYEYETLPIDLFGFNIEELSQRQLQNLADKISQTQTLAMDTQVESATTITQPAAGMRLAGRDLDISPSHGESGKGSKASASNKGALSTQKRRLDASIMSTASKRARIVTDKDDSVTESESESDSDARRSTTDSHSDNEAPPPPKPKVSTSTTTRPQPTLAGRGVIPFVCPPGSVSAKPPAKTSTAATSTTARTSATSYLVRHPPPTDLADNEALLNWALKLAEDRARELNPSSSSSNPEPSQSQRPDHPMATTTTTHVAQAIENHRAGRAAAEQLGSQQNPNSSSQATSTPTHDSTPAVTPSTATTATSGKKKYRRKTKLSDFPGRVGEIASAAIPCFLATVFAEGGYENLDTFQDWALDAYRRSYELEYPEEVYEPPPVGVLKIMTRRASWLRGEIKKQLRAGVEYSYGFRNPAASRRDIKHNRRLAKKLKPQVLHCKDLVFDTDQFEHREVVRAIGAGLFWNPKSLGVASRDRFNPVPIPAVALVLTMMQACIGEWKDGRHQDVELDVDTQKKVYESHLLSLYSYETIAASRLTRFRTQWAAAGLDYSGATFDEDPAGAKSYVLASNVRPDTPPPETHNNEHDD